MKRIAVKVSGFVLVVFLLSPLVVCAAFIRAGRDTPGGPAGVCTLGAVGCSGRVGAGAKSYWGTAEAY
jgi:hypothetical protein